MHTFQTPQPIAVVVDALAADVIVTASDRTDTVVVVRPADESKKADVRAAEHTEVEFRDGTLRVTTPKTWLTYTPFGGNPAITVTIEVPTGSELKSTAGVGHVRGAGALGHCDLTVALGDITIERPQGSVTAKTSKGDIRIGVATRGEIRLETSVGELEVGINPGSAVHLETDATVGTVQNTLAPVGSEPVDTVQVFARSSLGNVIVRHADAA
ncbi:GIN domain-containing protein [Nocardia sp. NPDC059180]|uniref:GIN domain-containing protein n=1 Tax=Nocardia sp. NPDC059180 TaxID=3346761 RepID=UPI003678E8FA